MKIQKDVVIIGAGLALIVAVYVARKPDQREETSQPTPDLVMQPTPTNSPAEQTVKSYMANDLDFSFAENAVRYRKQVVSTVNAIMRLNHSCADVDTDTLISRDEHPSSNPAMQIVCKDSNGTPFAVQFHAKDAANRNIVPAVKPISEDEAGKWCQRLLAAKLPASSSAILENAYFWSSPGGNASVVGEADSDEHSYKVICRFRGQVPTAISVNAKRDAD